MGNQGMFGVQAEEWLNKARHTAEKIAVENGKVDIEDVLEVCPRPRFLHRNITGKVFTKDVFRVVAFKKSRRAVSKGRMICVWGLKRELYPVGILGSPEPFVREFGDSY